MIANTIYIMQIKNENMQRYSIEVASFWRVRWQLCRELIQNCSDLTQHSEDRRQNTGFDTKWQAFGIEKQGFDRVCILSSPDLKYGTKTHKNELWNRFLLLNHQCHLQQHSHFVWIEFFWLINVPFQVNTCRIQFNADFPIAWNIWIKCA